MIGNIGMKMKIKKIYIYIPKNIQVIPIYNTHKN